MPAAPLAGAWLQQFALVSQPLAKGDFLEIMVYDTVTGGADGTAIVGIEYVHAADAAGLFVEAIGLGASSPARVPEITGVLSSNLTPPHRGALHLCSQQSSGCLTVNHWPGRSVIHSDTIRLRPSAGITEPWTNQFTLQGLRHVWGLHPGGLHSFPPAASPGRRSVRLHV